MAKIDISKLSATELDQLIADAAKQRSKSEPQIPNEPPESGESTVDPAWRSFMSDEYTVLLLRHTGLGWVSFMFPPHERAHILSLFLQQALAKPAEAPAAPISTPTTGAGGGTIH